MGVVREPCTSAKSCLMIGLAVLSCSRGWTGAGIGLWTTHQIGTQCLGVTVGLPVTIFSYGTQAESGPSHTRSDYSGGGLCHPAGNGH